MDIEKKTGMIQEYSRFRNIDDKRLESGVSKINRYDSEIFKIQEYSS